MNELINTNGTMTLEISEDFMATLNEIKADGTGNYITGVEGGVKIGDDIYSECFSQIVDIDKYHYLWQDGKNKLIKRNMGKEKAKSQGYANGIDLIIRMIKPASDDLFTFSLPQSSYWNFAKYVQHLLSRGLTPKHVITKIKTLMRQFKAGKPVPVATFEAVAPIQGQEQAPVDVTPKPAPETPAPAQQAPEQTIPAEWT